MARLRERTLSRSVRKHIDIQYLLAGLCVIQWPSEAHVCL